MPKILTLLILMFCAAAIAEAQVSSSSKLKLSYVEEGMGCGCSVSYNSSDSQKNKHVLIIPMDDDAYVTIDEKKLQLRLITSSKAKATEKVGDRSWEIYSARNVKVRVDYVVTRVCDPDDEGCEATYYRANMTVTKGKQSRVVKGIAICGC